MTTNQARGSETAVRFRDVAKVYHPDVRALDNVCFSIRRGETVALLGPNGAGKTTAIDIMLGLRMQTSGEVHVLGQTPAAAVAAGKIGGMLQTSGLPEAARVGELVALFRQLYGGSRSQSELLALAGLSDLAGRPVDKLSGGQMQRVRFALALAGRPELLFLDEPTVGLDVEARRHFWQSLRTVAAEGTTVLFATHYLDEADANASRVIVISKGQVIADGTPAQIKAGTSGRVLRAVTPDPEPALLLALPGVADVFVQGEAVTIRTTDADATLHAWYGLGRPIRGLDIGGGGLEEALLALTGTGAGASGGARADPLGPPGPPPCGQPSRTSSPRNK